jgi:hypothetical protein
MSKRALKKYLSELTQEQIAEQLLELYEKFSEVKTYYDFVFNPNEEKLIREAKLKITNEYFPMKSKRAKLRRSVAQKQIKHFLVLGVDSFAVADVMLHNIETALRYSAKREMRYASFYKSILTSFEQVVKFAIEKGMVKDLNPRFAKIYDEIKLQRWDTVNEFGNIIDSIAT